MLLVGVLAACATPPASPVAPSPSTIHVVMDDNYPPYVFKDDRGNVRGILADQWKLWEERTGVQVDLNAIPWGEALQRMRAGEFDVIDTIFYTEERARSFDFTAPYARLDVPIFFPKKISGIADAEDVKGFRVAVKLGDANAEYLIDQGVTSLVYYDSYEEIVKAVAEQKETIFVIDQPPALYFLYKYGLQDQFNHSAPLYSGEFHRAVKKGNPAILNLVTNGFSRISPAEYQAIDQRWLGTSAENAWQRLMPYLGLGAASAGLIILILIGFSWVLRKRVRQRTRALEETLNALHESRRFLAELVEYSGTLICVKDREGRYELVNRKWEEVTGLKRSDVIGKTDEVLFPGPIGRQFRLNDLAVIEAGTVLEMEELFEDAQGPRFFISIKFPLHGEDDHVKGLCGMITEITERKQAEAALQASEQRMRAILDAAPFGAHLYELEPEGRLVFQGANASADQILHLDHRQFIGKILEEAFPPLVETEIPAAYRRVAATGERYQRDQIVYHDSEISGAFELHAFQTGPNQMAVFFRDVTERKQMEEALRLSNEALEQRVLDRTLELAAANAQLTELDQLKSKFVSDVSHELRTPIANLKLYIDLLRRGHREKQAHYLDVLHQQVRRVAALVDDILDLSRLERRKEQGVNYQAVALDDVVKQVVLAHQPRAEAEGLRLTVELAPALPPVLGDANQLAQVVTNLVANALSYTTAGYVRVRADLRDKQVCLCVEDSGSGIPAEDLPHIFERFYRGHLVLKNDVPGTGLGLAIVKEIVELHQGQLEVDSRPGQGTTFRAWLPVAQPA